MIRTTIYLLLILLISALLRFWQLGFNPPSLYWDEVSQAFNSYSILQTGRDEHKELLPLARFQAFGDYKAPVYIYLDVPFIALFGKTEFAVRFPSALFGTLTVLVTFFLTREIFFRNKNRDVIALASAFLLAISPWHIQLSRAAYEANIATFFSVLGICLFLYAFRIRPLLIIVSAASFVLAFYAFNAHRIFIPLMVGLLSVLYYKELFSNKRLIIAAGVVGVILLIPFFQYFSTPESRLRFREVNIFSDLSVIENSNERQAYSGNSLPSRIFDNRRVLFSMLFMKHYFDFLNPMYLFFTGDENPRFSLQDNGILYLFELPLLLLGLYVLLTAKNRTTLLLGGWFLLAPIAAATARETPHALRSETLIPLYQIIGGVGAVFLFDLLNKRLRFRYKYPIVAGGGLLIVGVSIFIFLHNYYVHFPTKYAGTWQYGYKEAVALSEKMKDQYDKIVFTKAYGRPYIYVAWYGGYTPQEYWNMSKVTRDVFGFYEVEKLGKYEFREQVVSSQDEKGKTLYVIEPHEIANDMKILKTVYFLNGERAFLLAVRN